MKRVHTKQLALALSVMATAVLAMTVFVWGSEYKCSLYHKHPERHPRIAVAKLLSERERPAAAETVASARAPLSQAVFIALGVLLFGPLRGTRPGLDRVFLVVRNETAAGKTALLIHFSSRPPPAMVL
ncbi:MAG: hypothetical protein WBD46_08725 [Acidobacteriaceae bacterium]